MQKPIYSAEEEQLLMARLWSPVIADDPEMFVMFCFPWGETNTPLAKFKGPRRWQRLFLRKVRDYIRVNKTIEVDDLLKMMKEAVASGRGIGKSALVAWLILWFLTTRIGSTVIVSANSENQLRSITWGELTKWAIMAINSHWWEISATKLVPANWLTDLVQRDLKKGTRYWGAEGKLWSEENPDSYAGPHNYDGMMVIFDEASGIPDPIWSVAAGFFTEKTANRFWFAFSNPRRNIGYFFDCFNSKQEFWGTAQVDARTVEDTDKKLYEEIISEFGEDSYEAQVEVYGEFPSEGDEQFISSKSVDEAIKRPRYRDVESPIVIGIDPGQGRPDPCSIVIRQGRDILDIKQYFESDSEALVDLLIDDILMFNPKKIFVDITGLGWGISGSLKRRFGQDKVKGINFAWSAKNTIRWGNKRSEMWGGMRDWIRKEGSLPDNKKLKKELTAPKRKAALNGKMFLSSKAEIKKELGFSPDTGDALALTFAEDVDNLASEQRKTFKRVIKDKFYRPGVASSWMGA